MNITPAQPSLYGLSLSNRSGDDLWGKNQFNSTFPTALCCYMRDKGIPAVYGLNPDARVVYKKAGYGLTERVLDASLCGAPQKRKRFFCIGKLGEEDGFLLPIIDKKLDRAPMTVRQYLGNELNIDHYYRHPRNYSRRVVYSVDEPSATIRGVNRPVPKGYLGHANDKVSVVDVRPLTTLERARIQTFPQDYCWSGGELKLNNLLAMPSRRILRVLWGNAF